MNLPNRRHIARLLVLAFLTGAGANLSQAETDTNRLGLRLAPTPDRKGVAIVSVVPDSSAAQKGLRVGDIISEVDHVDVTTPEAFSRLADLAVGAGRRSLFLLVDSDGSLRYLTLPVQQSAVQAMAAAPRPPASAPEVRDVLDFFRGEMALHGSSNSPPDPEKAAMLFRKSAEGGNVDSMERLGTLYHLGQGVAKDDAEAAKWFRKAAELDSAPAQFDLAQLYSTGDGVPKDPVQAEAWMKKSARGGNIGAEWVLGSTYGFGPPDSQNLPLAYAYLSIAEAGSRKALASLQATAGGLDRRKEAQDKVHDEIAKLEMARTTNILPAIENLRIRLSPQQMAQGQQLLARWNKGEDIQ